MIITCPACSTKYTIPPNAIPAEGRTVKCTSCSHSWMQMPEGSNTASPPSAPKVQPVPSGSNLPVKVGASRNETPAWIKVASIFLLFGSGLISFMTFHQAISEAAPFTQAVYNGLGLYNTHDVVLTEMQASVRMENNKLAVNALGKIANESGVHTRTMQPVHIYILSEKGYVMGKVVYEENKGSPLLPESFLPFKSDIGNVSGNATSVVLDIGNWLERLFR